VSKFAPYQRYQIDDLVLVGASCLSPPLDRELSIPYSDNGPCFT
jgi:hypothetical protein